MFKKKDNKSKIMKIYNIFINKIIINYFLFYLIEINI